jgi:hypothetical protein
MVVLWLSLSRGQTGGLPRVAYGLSSDLEDRADRDRPVEIQVPRDRDGSFEPGIVPKRKRRLDGIDQFVLSLSARGLTTGEIAAHFEEVYGAKVSKDTISKFTEKGHAQCHCGLDLAAVHAYDAGPDDFSCAWRPG